MKCSGWLGHNNHHSLIRCNYSAFGAASRLLHRHPRSPVCSTPISFVTEAGMCEVTKAVFCRKRKGCFMVKAADCYAGEMVSILAFDRHVT